MEHRIELVEPMKLVGCGKRMSLASDATAELWKVLMPRRHEIENRATSDFISMRVYDSRNFGTNEQFLPEAEFDKWAAVEVTDHDNVPDGLEAYVLEGGTYAIFVHEGPASAFAGTMRRIFVDWLPASVTNWTTGNISKSYRQDGAPRMETRGRKFTFPSERRLAKQHERTMKRLCDQDA